MVRAEEIVAQLPLQKSGKEAILEDVKQYAEHLRYSVSVEPGYLLIGDPRHASYLLSCGTAVSGVAAWLELLRTFPENRRQKVCFILFDGKFGISSFRKNYAVESAQQLLIHLDHVGDGKHLRMYPTKHLKADRRLLTSLYRACGYFGTRDLLVEEGKRPFFLKECTDFPYAVTICSLQPHKKAFRYPHKTKNTGMDETNVNILRAALTTYFCCGEVNLERNMKNETV